MEWQPSLDDLNVMDQPRRRRELKKLNQQSFDRIKRKSSFKPLKFDTKQDIERELQHRQKIFNESINSKEKIDNNFELKSDNINIGVNENVVGVELDQLDINNELDFEPHIRHQFTSPITKSKHSGSKECQSEEYIEEYQEEYISGYEE